MRDDIIRRNLVLTITSLLLFFFLTLFINSSTSRNNIQNSLINISNIMNNQISNDVSKVEEIVDNFTDDQSWLKVKVTSNLGKGIYDSTDDSPSEYLLGLSADEIAMATSKDPDNERIYINSNEMYYLTLVTDDIIVRTSITIDNNERYILTSAFYMLILIAIVLLVGIVYSRKTSDIIESAFKSISDNLKTINSGEYHKIDTYHKYEEVREALEGINDISASIYQYIISISKERDKVRYIVNNMRQGLIIVGRNGYILICNKYAIEALHLDNDYENKLFHEVVNIERINKKVLNSLHTKSDVALDYFDEATEKVYNFMISYIDDRWQENDEKGLLFISVIDVSDERKNDAIKAEFIANASHELKTPITSISGFSELLLSGMGVCDELAIKYIKKIHDETIRMKETIDELLYLSNLENKSSMVELTETIYLDEIIMELVESYQETGNNKNVKISYDVVPTTILGSESLIRHLISNLVENAIKYNKENGSVKVIIEDHENFVYLKVSDTGIGISSKDYNKIFDRFYRIEASRNRSTGGTGLGLTIVKKICMAHDTSIDIDSELGVGTTFSIKFMKYIENKID